MDLDFEAMEVKEAFAKFLREQMRNLGLTVADVAYKSKLDEKTVYSYLKPAQAPKKISDNFYAQMQATLQFQHQDFCQYYENHYVDQSRNSISNLNISGGTFRKTVFGARDVHFHDAKDNTDD